MLTRGLPFAAGLGALLVLAGCSNDSLMPPSAPSYTGGALFLRYVSIGNSLTAGFQSGGINDSTQKQAYPVILAAAMATPFYRPSLASIGCPPPFDSVFTATGIPHRLGGTTATTCFFRSPTTSPYVSNVAVPGAAVIDVTQNGPGAGTNSNPLTQLILGGRTQIQAMATAHPTFVSVWIGNNDVLGSFTALPNAGDSTLITPPATFQTYYQKIVDSIKATGAKAVLVGVGNVTEIPYASQGQVYFALKNTPPSPFPSNFTVGANCAPPGLGGKGDSVLVPFPFGAALIGAARADPGGTYTLSCTETQTVQPAELRKLVTTVTAYNAFISAAATTNGWAYLDPNPTLDSLRAIPTQVAPFPNLQAACSGSPFGLAFSCDGVHPSGSTHVLIARHLVQVINAKYGSAIPTP